MRTDRLLRPAAATFAVGFLIHNADHARRGIGAITDHVVWGGTIVAMLAAVVLTLVVIRHQSAPAAALAVGAAVAIAVSASHLLPTWSAFSDSLPQGDVDGLTWFAVLAEVLGAVFLAVAALAALRTSGAPRSTAASRAAQLRSVTAPRRA